MIGKKWARNDEKRQNSRYVRDFRTLTLLVDGTSSDETITSYRTKERFYTITRQIILALPLKKKKRKLIFPLNSSKLFEQQLKLHFDTDIIITTIQVTYLSKIQLNQVCAFNS